LVQQLLEIDVDAIPIYGWGGDLELTMIGAIIGMVIVVSAFALETQAKVSSRSIAYLAGMALGQILLGIRAYDTGEWPFAVLSAVWAGVAFLAILKPRDDEAASAPD